MTETIRLDVPSATTVEGAGPFPSGIDAYLARPAGEPRGAVIVIHEVWGLVDHIRGIADRYAAEGYLAVAPDLLSAIGIEEQVGAELFAIMTSTDERLRTENQPRLRDAFTSLQTPGFAEWAVQALRVVVDRLEPEPGVRGRIAVSGFCFGGTYSFALATADPRVRVAIPFYGSAPEPAAIAGIRCPVHAFYGADDARLIEALPDVEARMAAAGVRFTPTVYEGAGHAFFNDTNPHAFRADAAADAWSRTLEILERELA